MRLEEAAEVFCEAFAFIRAFTYPCESLRVGGLLIARDAQRRREPRSEEIIVCGLDYGEALRQIEAYRPPKHFVSAIASPEEDPEAQKRAYKSAGYRLIVTEGFFVRNLAATIPKISADVRRVESLGDAERVRLAAGRSQIPPEQLRGNQVRLYAAWIDGEAAGWVRSIHLRPEAAWVSNLYVRRVFRRQGLGSALMSKLLSDDRAHGVQHSVLTASRVGAKLYPGLGYEQVGLLQCFHRAAQTGS